jgi:hypothetical protein
VQLPAWLRGYANACSVFTRALLHPPPSTCKQRPTTRVLCPHLQHGLPDAAAALVAACREADLPLVQPGPSGAELANLWQGAGQAPPARFDSGGCSAWAGSRGGQGG